MSSQDLSFSIRPLHEVSLCGLSSRIVTLLMWQLRILQSDIDPFAHYISLDHLQTPQILCLKVKYPSFAPNYTSDSLSFPEVEATKSSQDLVPGLA